MVDLFVSGGPLFMSILTLLFVAILIAAWKAPAWVKDLGRIALVFGILGSVLGFYQMFSTLGGSTPPLLTIGFHYSYL